MPTATKIVITCHIRSGSLWGVYGTWRNQIPIVGVTHAYLWHVDCMGNMCNMSMQKQGIYYMEIQGDITILNSLKVFVNHYRFEKSNGTVTFFK